MDNIKTGLYIKEKRKQKGLTQKELADILNCTDKAVSRWETGNGFPEISFLLPLSQALDISVNELIIGEDIKREEYIEKSNEAMIKTLTSTKKKIKKFNIVTYTFLILLEVMAFIAVSLNATPSDAMGLVFFHIGVVFISTVILGFTDIKMHVKFIYIPITIILHFISVAIYFGDIFDMGLPYAAIYIIMQSVLILLCSLIRNLISALLLKIKKKKSLKS